jgi:predicted ATPase/signal transduction histidine kinase
MFALTGYNRLEELYQNTKTVIYRAVREMDKQSVIIKILNSEYPTSQDLTRLRYEYEITQKINLSGVMRSYGLEPYNNSLALILEDFGGQSLKEFINQKRLDIPTILSISIQLVDTIGKLHKQQIIHKDIKPDNIIFNANTKQVKFTDFSISCQGWIEHQTVNQPTTLEGTLAYMSPEQTGRMNRKVDYRSDYYSLGVTFYELLVNRLPFETNDPMELVHCHIAKLPAPPHLLNPAIPPQLAAIVMKLLEKNAENRYQSASGLKADLQICLKHLQSLENIADFVPGQYDISETFQIPQKLYGRTSELETLLNSFDQICHGKSGIVLISGYSGIGKTVLVQEIYKPVTAKRGYFISGKFEQFQRTVPYSALIKAFKELVKQLCMESETALNRWRDRLLATLGINAQVIIEVIPEVELIVGKPSPVPDLPPAQAQNRFNLVFQNFIRVFAKFEHPLVIFLDDLQWADTASLKLMQLLVTSDSHYLLFIGTYRDNEVNASHPLSLLMAEIQKAGTFLQQIYLSALELTDLNQLIADLLNSPLEKTLPLAELVLAKTQGNPFFVNVFLKSLHDAGLLYFEIPTVEIDNADHVGLEASAGSWQWDLAKIQAREITDNVGELLTGKIQQLGVETQQLLQLASCIGNHFKLETLHCISEESLKELMWSLQEAVREGLLLPLGSDNFQFAIFCSSVLLTRENDLATEYKFAHDRIRQVAYSLISFQQRQQCHQRIGQLLLKNTPIELQDAEIFNIVNQLNLGRDLLTQPEKRDELAQLNLLAGQKAKAAAAYDPALRYSKIGLELLGEASWQRCYSLSLQLSVEAAELAYLIGEFEDMEELTTIVLQEAKSLLDQVKAYEIRMQAYKAQNQPQEAVKLGLLVLKQLGVKFPSTPTKFHTALGLLTTKWALSRKTIGDLLALPTMVEPYKLAAMRIMLSISPAVYAIMPRLLPLIVFKRIKLSIQYGNAYESAPAYASYGYTLCAIEGNIETGYQFGQLALQLLEKDQIKELKARIFQIVHGVITHYKEHVQSTLKPLLEAYHSGLETGNFEYATLSATTYAMHAYLVGKELTTLEREIAVYTESFLQLKQEASLHLNHIYWQAILNLRGYTENGHRLIGDVYNEEVMLPIHQKARARGIIFQVYIHKLILCYLFQNYSEAFENARLAEKYLDAVIGSLLVPLFHFYDSLARLALFANVAPAERHQILKKVATNQQKMITWATHAPMNYLHKYYLVEAERARVLQRDGEAREWYDRAINLAQQHEYLNDEALANELAGTFYFTQKHSKLAQLYLREAHYAYSRWGATAKVKQLETQYPQFINKYLPAKASSATVSSVTTTIQGNTKDLDLTTVFKASQAFVGEIVLRRLIEKLMRIVIENAGAQTGFLLLQQNGQWLIQAKATINSNEVETSRSQTLEDSSEVAVGIIHYVARTKEYVVLNDATRSGNFANDPHIQRQQPKSVLCVPLINQAKLTSILYLENNLVSGVFTSERLELLYLLSSQMAISIENARLYADLEDKVRERTKNLAAQNAKLIVLNEKLVKVNQEKNEFLSIAAHDLKNPLSAIQGLAEMIVRDFDEMSKSEIFELANMISLSSQQMFELIKNLLDVNRLESGNLNISLGVFNILPVLEWVVKDYRERAKNKNITLLFYGAEAEYYALGDEKILRQVLDNLISNAVKYSPRDRQIYVRVSKNKQSVRCEIQDEGPGLSDEDKQQLFGKFTRLTPQPTGDENSTGLGLFIVKKLVAAMRGKVWCETEVGKGATFIVEFRTEL